MNILYLGSHSILEYDQVRLWSDLGYNVFSIGAYTDPARPGDDKRPPLLDVPSFPHLADLCREKREEHAGQSIDYPVIDWAKYDLHAGLIDWADTIIVDCFPESWIPSNWSRIRDKRVIWRTIGQSGPQTELALRPYEGLQIVRYSPAERRAFEPLGCFAGEDALIRFAKYPADWGPWNGSIPKVFTVAQNLYSRGEFTHADFWDAATAGLPRAHAGPGSENHPDGLGSLTYDDLRGALRDYRCFLYTGTQPASYTLGLIEAMLSGIPVVSIGPKRMMFPLLFEGHELVQPRYAVDDPALARVLISELLGSPLAALGSSGAGRANAIDLFSADVIGPQWRDFLGPPSEITMQGLVAVA